MFFAFDTKDLKCIEKLLGSDVRENNLKAAGIIMYRIFATNTQEQKNHKINRVEILFDLIGSNYKLKDTTFIKNIVLVSGQCDLLLTNNLEEKIVSLIDISKTIQIEKNINVELKSYTPETKIVIEYIGENNE